jgi:large subunit ribosomal protein L1
MGKKKTVMIDDSVIEEKAEPRKKLNPNPAKEEAVESPRAKLNPNRAKLNPNPAEKETSDKSPESSKKEEPKKASKTESASAKANSDKEKKESKVTHGKKYQEMREKVERNKPYAVAQAVELAKEVSYTKFDGTIEIHVNTAVKNVRGLVSLPFASGKSLTVIAFGKGADESGADIVGDDAKLADIVKGKINFDVIVTDPTWMPKLAGAAKVLGPKGMMPNPKNGTISTDLKKAVTEIKSGKVEYKTERNGQVIHLSVGKVSQATEEITQNVKLLLGTIGKTKIKQAVLTPTMGPSVKIDISSI